jgi:hypothetical protein
MEKPNPLPEPPRKPENRRERTPRKRDAGLAVVGSGEDPVEVSVGDLAEVLVVDLVEDSEEDHVGDPVVARVEVSAEDPAQDLVEDPVEDLVEVFRSEGQQNK